MTATDTSPTTSTLCRCPPNAHVAAATLTAVLRESCDTIIDRELRRLARRTHCLADNDLGVVEAALHDLVERMLLARIQSVPHLTEHIATLFAVGRHDSSPPPPPV